jgi:hypothetical protein
MSTEAAPWFAIDHRLWLVGNALTLAAANAIKTVVDKFLSKGDVELPLLDAVRWTFAAAPGKPWIYNHNPEYAYVQSHWP